MDVSRSMRVTDVKPNRLVAAQEAAKTFLAELPKDIEVGLITFAGSAQVVQPATLDRASLVAAIDAFQMQYGTAVGNAIVLCLSELFPDHGIDLGEMTFGPYQRAKNREDKTRPPSRRRRRSPVPPGSYDSAAIILLTDGRRTTGIDTLEAAADGGRPRRSHLRGRPRHRRRRDSRWRGHGDLLKARRADPARGGAHDRRRVPPRRHRGEAARRLPEPRLAPAGADARDRDRADAGAGGGAAGGHGSGALDDLVRRLG
jgi:hypothetical protein